jgi:hypothetical protein
MTGYDPNCVYQEVVLQLPTRYENCVEQLLHLRVPCLNILEDLTDKVHCLLLDFYRGFWAFNDDDCADHSVDGCHIQKQHIIGLGRHQRGHQLEILLELNEGRCRLIIPLETIYFA